MGYWLFILLSIPTCQCLDSGQQAGKDKGDTQDKTEKDRGETQDKAEKGRGGTYDKDDKDRRETLIQAGYERQRNQSFNKWKR